MLKLLLIGLICLYPRIFAQDLNYFVKEIKSNQDKVAEFTYLREQAKLLGIKHVYLFGGSATSYAYYVRMFLRKQLGIETLQDDRFDFDYYSIFRAEQDFDIVIDGTAEQAAQLESQLQDKFKYFIGKGTKSIWEVRLLRESRADKDAILGFDFQNQHTDSHSTGLIDLMPCEENECIKDIKNFNTGHNQFLEDIHQGLIKFYYAEKHKQTKRYIAGKNPEIIATIRYFTKAVQTSAKMRKEDIAILQKFINEFDEDVIKNSDPYVATWIEKNAKKLIVNAMDMEYASNLISEVGLKDKLIKILKNQNTQYSSAWWLNKEPLRTKPLATFGKTAKELFGDNIMVAHETNSFEAYESITKAHAGYPNVLISRKYTSGENSCNGEGFYVALGSTGMRGTGLTIRFILNPNAREGVDFTNSGGREIVIFNRAALAVIPESLDLSVFEYLKKIRNGVTFDPSDRSLLERMNRKKKKNLTSEEKQKIINLAKEEFKFPRSPRYNSEQPPLLIQELLKLDIEEMYDLKEFSDWLYSEISRTSSRYLVREFYSSLHAIKNKNFVKWIDFSIKEGLWNEYLSNHILTNPLVRTLYRDDFIRWANIALRENSNDSFKNVLAKPKLIDFQDFVNLANQVNFFGDINLWSRYTEATSYLAQYPDHFKKIVESLSYGGWQISNDTFFVDYVFSNPEVKKLYGYSLNTPARLVYFHVKHIKPICNDFFVKLFK